MSKPYRSSVLLRMAGTEVDPERVTELLGLEPHRARRRHDPLGEGDATTAPLDPRGAWRRYLPPELANAALEDQIDHWLELLDERGPGLETLRSEGLQPALSCFVTADTVASVVLPPEAVERLAALGLQIELSIFAESEPEDELS